MINREYIILRSPRSMSLGDPFSGPNIFPRTGPGSTIPGNLGENRAEAARAGAVGTVGAGREIKIDIEPLAKRDIADLRRDPEVESIAPAIPTKLIEPRAGSSDFEFAAEDSKTWGVEATKAGQSPYTGAGITVAVLDTGIDAGHSAFSGVNLNQNDFTGEGDADNNGHGTHVAGSIFGRMITDIRYSTAPGIERVLIGKVLGANGGGTTDMIYQAILWAVDNGAQLINMSLGFDFPGMVANLSKQGIPTDLATSWALESYRSNLRLFDRLAALISARAAFGMGALIIAAAGNESSRELNPDYEIAVSPPAAADGILAIGALKTAGKPHDALTVADFSNTGANVCGPGVDILSARSGGGFDTLSGTSMASPHVTGVAALWAEKMVNEVGFFNPNRLIADLISRATTENLAPDYDPLDVGAGMVQAPLA